MLLRIYQQKAGVVYIRHQPLSLIIPKKQFLNYLYYVIALEWKQWRSNTAKSLKKAGNSNRQKGTCMKCYDMEVLDAKMSFFQSGDYFRSYVNLGKSHNLINDFNYKMAGLWTYPTLRLSNCWNLVIEMWKTGKTLFWIMLIISARG